VFLLVTAQVVGVFPFAVRPDMFGVSLQTTGLLLLLSVWLSGRPRDASLLAAFAFFALAVCVKQHLVMGPLFGTLLLMVAWRRGQFALRSIERGLLVACTILLVVYGTEEFMTGGRMSQAVFFAPASLGRIHPTDWFATLNVLLAITARSSGLFALLLASCLTLVPVAASPGRLAFVAAGTLLVVPIFALVILQIIEAPLWLVMYVFQSVFAAVLIALLACAFLEPMSLARGRLDRALWCYLAGEIALMAVLCRSNAGAWMNYAIPSVVVLAVLTARVLDRALSATVSLRRLLPIALAASIVPIAVATGLYQPAVDSRNEERVVAQISRVLKRPPSEFFFIGRPGDNRVHGRTDLVYDDWLYAVFESMHLAEVRSIWLERALTAGPVRFVVKTSGSPEIDGAQLTLPRLGYSRRLRAGPFVVWERANPRIGPRLTPSL
jgi:hypothetical protein